MLKVVLD